MTEVRIPEDMWDIRVIPEGVVSTWYYDEGDDVTEGSVVAVIMVEKTELDIVAPQSGKLHILADTNAVVVPGTVIGSIESGNSG